MIGMCFVKMDCTLRGEERNVCRCRGFVCILCACAMLSDSDYTSRDDS